MLRFFQFVFAIAAFIFGATPVAGQSEPLVFTNFQYFDSYSRTMVASNRMVIEDGKIKSIGTDECAGCREMDLASAFVTPGLIDMHQHLSRGGFSRETMSERLSLFRRNLYFGITTAFNPSIPTPVLSQLAPKIAATPSDYPRFLTASRTIGPEGGWGDLRTSTIGGLKTAIDRQIAAGAVVVKLSYDDQAWLNGEPLPLFSKAALQTAIDYAHLRERRVFVHSTTADHARTALDAGADGIISGLISGAVDADLINLFKANRAVYVATLSPFHAIANVQRSVERQMAYDPKRLNGTSLYKSLSSLIMAQNVRDWWPKAGDVPRMLNQLYRNSKALIDAGIMVGIGTDAGTPAVVFGASFADEMHLHTEMGLSPQDVLWMATLGNARILNLDKTTGSIEVGKDADLVVLKEDPTRSPTAFKTIQYTVRAGRLHDRENF